MVVDEYAARGARNIITRSLGLAKGQELVIFADETTQELAQLLAVCAYELAIVPTILTVPVVVQREIPRRWDLSLLTQVVAREARAILICVNGEADCLGFRKRVIRTNWDARSRIGHMPGGDMRMLRLADVDYDQVIHSCQGVALALVQSQRIELTTYAQDGTEHLLTANLGRWDRPPVASDGVIQDGAWGNVPSGETYIAPLEGTARGSVVINGSIPKHVLARGEEIVLRFGSGRLLGIEPEDAPITRLLYEHELDIALRAGDPNWTNLAEIGIGANPAVEKLTGDMLLDEKAARTAHVALGSNSFMGGDTDSAIHCDMVTLEPSISVDGRPLMERGVLFAVSDEWQADLEYVLLDQSPLRNASTVAVSVEGVYQGSGLYRRLYSGPGHISLVRVGSEQTSDYAARLYSLLPEDGRPVAIASLARDVGLAETTARRVLHIMWEYELVRI